ncbi:MAG: hypothetical protein KME42_22450 [Tildeniella nuda ZEHNDER 1965/U140]|nr:hypothetical protein [Tildeniella nuda ZEHNDER 1965/U140]
MRSHLKGVKEITSCRSGQRSAVRSQRSGVSGQRSAVSRQQRSAEYDLPRLLAYSQARPYS